MDILNNKITSTNDETKFSTQNVGLYGFDTATDGGKWRRVAVNTNGELEMTAEITSAGLATEAKQDTIIANMTDGNQIVKCMGSEDGSTSGTQRQLHIDGSGNVLVKEVGTVNIAPSNDTNSGISNDPTNSLAVGLRGRTTITDSTTETFLLCDASGKLEVNTSGGGGGDATAANQTLQLAQETIIANGFYQENDSIGATDVGVLVMGRNGTNTAKPIHITNNGDVEVEIADFVKGQTTMANSFPVVISSDQSRLDVDTVKDEVVISQANQAITNGNAFTSTAVDMRGYERISFFGTSTNTSDFIYILVSADDITYYTTGNFITQDFTTGDFSFDATLGARYFKLTQASTDFNSNFTISCISSKK